MDTRDGNQLNEVQFNPKLAAYYLNTDNFYTATEDSITQLLTDFWKNYSAYESSDADYQLLGVEGAASWEDIQVSYRRKIQELHPDKGGDAAEFDKVRGAYQRLKKRKARQ